MCYSNLFYGVLVACKNGEQQEVFIIFDEPITGVGQDDAAKAKLWSLSYLPHLSFDYYDILQDAIKLYSDLLLK